MTLLIHCLLIDICLSFYLKVPDFLLENSCSICLNKTEMEIVPTHFMI